AGAGGDVEQVDEGFAFGGGNGAGARDRQRRGGEGEGEDEKGILRAAGTMSPGEKRRGEADDSRRVHRTVKSNAKRARCLRWAWQPSLRDWTGGVEFMPFSNWLSARPHSAPVSVRRQRAPAS